MNIPTPSALVIPNLTIETDPNYIWLALRDGDVVVVENWTPDNPLRTRVYRYNARLPRDMRMKIAALRLPDGKSGLSNIYLLAGGLTLSVARASIHHFIANRIAESQT
jgi:hypothetical protein